MGFVALGYSCTEPIGGVSATKVTVRDLTFSVAETEQSLPSSLNLTFTTRLSAASVQ